MSSIRVSGNPAIPADPTATVWRFTMKAILRTNGARTHITMSAKFHCNLFLYIFYVSFCLRNDLQ